MKYIIVRWLVFFGFLAVLFTILGLGTAHLLRMEQQNLQSVRNSQIQESVRVALWRIDSTVGALMIRENSRPTFQFEAFYETEQQFSSSYKPFQKGDVLSPSPLLGDKPPHTKLYFAYSDTNSLRSPQVPLGNQRNIAISNYTVAPQIDSAEKLLTKLKNDLPKLATLAAEQCSPDMWVLPTEPEPETSWSTNNFAQQIEYQQRGVDNRELLNRGRIFNKIQKQAQEFSYNSNNSDIATSPPKPVINIPMPSEFVAIWKDSELYLMRSAVASDAKTKVTQGVWLDWQSLHKELLEDIKDLFPNATIEPVVNDVARIEPDRLASIPARLIPNETMVAIGTLSKGTPLRRALVISWLAIIAAVIAMAALIRGVIALSERRGAFVSAVTHELRTPLTTFRLYTDLLAEGAPDKKKRANYVNTLRGEAERLGHLVENVLAYAQLERGSAAPPPVKISIAGLVSKVSPVLERRAMQDGMMLDISIDPKIQNQSITVNVDSVERILFNLVDNSCKYAQPEDLSEQVIHLEATHREQMILLKVRDHGRGIDPTEARRLFRPFQKSAQDAANSAPGVGLGLSLCRKISRSLGGNLHLESPEGAGASFVLELPR